MEPSYNHLLRLAGAVLLFLNATACERLKKDAPERALVKVGENVITVGAFNDSLKRLLPEGSAGISEEEPDELKKRFLTLLIEEELIIIEAKKRRIETTEEELSKEMTAMQEMYGEEEFKKDVLSRYRDMDEWGRDLKRKLLIKKALHILVKAEVTEADALAHYEKNTPDYEIPEQARARMIVVGTEKEAEAVKERAGKENFETIARELSIGPEAKQGGDLGFFGRGDMPPEFEEVVFSLPIGKISNVVKTSYGFHVFKVEERKKGRKPGFAEVKSKIMEKLKQEKVEETYRDWIISLKNTTTIEIKGEIP